MDIIYFELRAANKDCLDKFTDVAKKKYKGTPIFEHACNYVNSSTSYKRTGRKLEIIEIADLYLKVKLTSETPLEMASKSLAGFSRELIRVDKEMYPDEDQQLFRLFIYNNTLFKNTQYEDEDQFKVDSAEMSDVDALQLCVQVFCNTMTSTKEEAAMNEVTKKQLKEILANFSRMKRLNAYNEKMRRK